MIDGRDKPKIPSMFAKGTAQYNDFRYNISKIKLPNFKVICHKRATVWLRQVAKITNVCMVVGKFVPPPPPLPPPPPPPLYKRL